MKELYTALANFNKEVDKIAKDATNPLFRSSYATVDQIITEIRPILAKNGLSIIQIPMNLRLNEGGEWVGIKTILLHESGQTLESEPFYLKAQGQKTGNGYNITPQSLGSAITYCRRYSLTSFLCLSTGQDDDANLSSGNNVNTANCNNNIPNNNQNNQSETLSEAQMKRYYALIKKAKMNEDELFTRYNEKNKKNITRETMSSEDYSTITNGLQAMIDKNSQQQ